MNSHTAIRNEPNPLLQTVAGVDRRSAPLLVADNTSQATGGKRAPNFRMICQPICRVGGRGGPAWVEMLIRGTGPDARQSPMEIVQRGYRSAGLYAARRALRRLRRMQVKIALDDFGPGYPNLDVLAEGLVDFVKLDRSLITALDRCPHQTGVLQGITALAKSTGVTLVAEGIETPGQMKALKRLGIEWMQGFLFGWPTTLQQTRSCSPETNELPLDFDPREQLIEIFDFCFA